MMKTNLLALLAYMLLWFFTGCSADIYVSPEGNDSSPGSFRKPFVTIQKAIEAAETSFGKKSQRDCRIWLGDGTYFIDKPIEIESENLKNSLGKLIFKAMPGAEPEISGGVKIENWQSGEDDLWRAELPKFFDKEQLPRELFVGTRRAVRARFPNVGFLRIKKSGEDRRTNFYFETGGFPQMENTESIELVFLHDWSITRIGVKDIDYEQNRLTAIDTIGTRGLAFFNIDGWEPNPRYFMENAMEFLDADYEWFINPEDRTVLLKLPAQLNPKDLEIIVPLSHGLVLLSGSEEKPLKNIHFEGIAFRYSAWNIPQKGYCGIQACHFDPRPGNGAWNVVPPAVMGKWLKDCSFKNCVFENLGGSGIWLADGCRNCTISGSRFKDISGNGVMIGEGRDRLVNGEEWWKSAQDQVASENVIGRCTITECGKQFYGAVGVWCGFTAGTKIRDNEIFNLPYTGISIGWMWNPTPTPCRENTIDGNHIHHIMQKLSDGGGVYMLGLQPGSKIIDNLIHDVSLNAGRAESNGMFLDEGTTDVVVANNIIYNIAKSPLRFHQATTNLVKENYLFCKENTLPIQYNATNAEDIQKVDNQVFYDSQPEFKEKLEKVVSVWKSTR